MLFLIHEVITMQNKLWTKNFTLLILATTLGSIGSIAGGFALSFLVYDETESTLASALILAAQLIPGFLIPTFFAPWMDRFPRKPFLVAGDLVNGVMYGLAGVYLLIRPFSYLGYLGYSLLLACLGSFDSLAYKSIYPNLIPKEMKEKGYAVSGMLYPVLSVVMMPLSALLMDTIGVAWILIGQGFLSILAAITENLIKLTEKKRLEEQKYSIRLWWRDLKDGISYLRNEKGLRAIYSYMAVTNGVAQGYGPLMIAFFRTMPGMTSFMYAMFSVAEFLGRSFGGLFCYHAKIDKKKKYGFAFAVYNIYETMDMSLLWLPYPLMLLNRGICGFLGINSATMREASVQAYIPDEYRARINAFSEVMILALSSIFSLLIGALGEIMDLLLCMTLCAAFTLIICWGTIGRRRREISEIYCF